MTESKARGVLRELVVRGLLPDTLPELEAESLLRVADEQGLATRLLAALEDAPASATSRWAAELLEPLTARRRAALARGVGQVALAAGALSALATSGVRALPLKGVVLADTLCDLESERPMADVDLLALERWPLALETLLASGLALEARADHAFVLRDRTSGLFLELHRSLTSAPGLFPLDVEGLWARRRPGRRQLAFVPSAEDLLVQLALHAAFQHGLVLRLVQWLDFRRLLESERVELERAWRLAAEGRAAPALAAALLAADAVVRLPLDAEAREHARGQLPAGLRRWFDERLATPLAFVEGRPELARVRLLLLAGRRLELAWRTLLLPETPSGDTRLLPRAAHALARGRRLLVSLPGAASTPCAPTGDACPPAALESAPYAAGEAALRECLASFASVRFTVTGRCMEPAIRDGEQVRLVAPARRRPRVGDVVLVRQEAGLRLHRLVWGPPFVSARGSWRSRPDRGPLLDPPFAADAVLGSVEAIERRNAAQPRRLPRALASLAAGVLAGVLWRRRAAARSRVALTALRPED